MEKYQFAKSINGTDETGIIKMANPPELICLCTKENSELILNSLNDATKNEQDKVLEINFKEKYIDLVRHINIMTRGMAEYFAQSNYREMWGLWNSLLDFNTTQNPIEVSGIPIEPKEENPAWEWAEPIETNGQEAHGENEVVRKIIAAACLKHHDSGEASVDKEARMILQALSDNGIFLKQQLKFSDEFLKKRFEEIDTKTKKKVNEAFDHSILLKFCKDQVAQNPLYGYKDWEDMKSELKNIGWEMVAEDRMIEAFSLYIIIKFGNRLKNGCAHDWDEGSHNVHKCKICGVYNC